MPNAAETFLILLIGVMVVAAYRLAWLGDRVGAAVKRVLGSKR